MHSHFLKKLWKETLYFSGCWLFLKKLNNKVVTINITLPLYNFKSPIGVYPPTNVRKNFVPTKFWQIFKLNLSIINHWRVIFQWPVRFMIHCWGRKKYEWKKLFPKGHMIFTGRWTHVLSHHLVKFGIHITCGIGDKTLFYWSWYYIQGSK